MKQTVNLCDNGDNRLRCTQIHGWNVAAIICQMVTRQCQTRCLKVLWSVTAATPLSVGCPRRPKGQKPKRRRTDNWRTQVEKRSKTQMPISNRKLNWTRSVPCRARYAAATWQQSVYWRSLIVDLLWNGPRQATAGLSQQPFQAAVAVPHPLRARAAFASRLTLSFNF